jgi:ABC-type multidrug transport system ATPase subunit
VGIESVGPPAEARQVQSEPQGPGRPPDALHRFTSPRLRIGRATDNDVVLLDLTVSKYHAELRRLADGDFEVQDLCSYSGTYLNGKRITTARFSESDLIGIGPATFRLSGTDLQEFTDVGGVCLKAAGLTVRLKSGKVLLDDVSFPLGERCLLGVIGPSGCGKTTLLGALTGIQPANDGTVLYDGRDLYQHYAELQHRIGMVPQENILHTQLSPRRALGYAARLRFPKDTSRAEREERIDEVLGELALTQHADTRTSDLSGGQRKRVNVALELLTRPSLLFLDEPTSGLDPGLDKSVMELIARLAHTGRTVIVATHSVANLSQCDRLLVLVPGGKLAFFGPPGEGLRHFGQPGWAEVFQAFEAEPDRDWTGEFRRSSYYARYVAGVTDDVPPARAPQPATPEPKTRNRLDQLITLCQRYLAVISADRAFLAALAIMPVLLGLLIRLVPSPQGLIGHNNTYAQSLLLVVIVGSCFTGAANAVRELVKERPIYGRERAAGLSAGAYLLSKVVTIGLLTIVQSLIMLAIGLTGRTLPAHGSAIVAHPLLELLIASTAVGIASMALGLMISAFVGSSDKTMPLLVVSVMFQVILSGGVFALHGKIGIEQLSWLAPSRWGYAATASTTNLSAISPAAMLARSPDPLWRHSAATWLLDMAGAAAVALLYALITWRRLVVVSPGRRRTQGLADLARVRSQSRPAEPANRAPAR